MLYCYYRFSGNFPCCVIARLERARLRARVRGEETRGNKPDIQQLRRELGPDIKESCLISLAMVCAHTVAGDLLT